MIPTERSSKRVSRRSVAFRSAARTTTAVPCLPIETLLDLEALGRGDVFQLDRSERGSDLDYRLDQRPRVARRDENGDSGEPDQPIQEDRLPFHDRKTRMDADVSEPEDRGAVGHDGHGASQGRVVPHLLRVGVDLLTDGRDSRRIDLSNVADLLKRDEASHSDLSAPVDLHNGIEHGLNDDPVQP
jgi:hypothetical protein